MSDDADFLAGRAPVPVVAGMETRPAKAAGSNARPAAEKFARRIAGLMPGRYEIVVTVSEGGIVDWSIRPLGKVER